MNRYENLLDKNSIENHSFNLIKKKLRHLVLNGTIKDFDYNKEEWNQEGNDITFTLWFNISEQSIGKVESICFDYDVIADEFNYYYDGKIPVEVFEVSSPNRVNWL